jgi:hypothetical protein
VEGGFAFAIQQANPQALLRSSATLLRDTSFAVATVGSGTYVGQYQIATANTDSRESQIHEGTVSMTVDFADSFITGVGDDLTFTGVIEGAWLSGTSTFQGMPGTLGGGAGRNQVVGTLVGGNGNISFAGGFAALPTRP